MKVSPHICTNHCSTYATFQRVPTNNRSFCHIILSPTGDHSNTPLDAEIQQNYVLSVEFALGFRMSHCYGLISFHEAHMEQQHL